MIPIRRPHRCAWKRGGIKQCALWSLSIRCPCCWQYYCQYHKRTHERAASMLKGAMGLFNDLHNRGVYPAYTKFVVELEPVLEAMSRRGMPVPQVAWAKTKAQLEERRQEIVAAMQALVPEECQVFHPKQGYKKEPKGAVVGGETEHGGVPATWSIKWFPVATLEMVQDGEVAVDPAWKEDVAIMGYVEHRWVKILPWNPSPKNLITYITYMGRTQPPMRAREYRVPTSFKTQRETTNQLELARLAKKTKDLLLEIVQEYREYSTVLDNHIKNWEPGVDGRVHPTFYYETGTGQLASRRPNVQNAPKHKKETADLFRGMVKAAPDRVLLEFDYKSCHVHTLAFEAQDEVLMRLAGIDPHSFVTAHLLKLPDANRCLTWDDEKLTAYLASIKKQYKEIRDAKVKHAFLGYDNGMGWKKLYNQYQEFFASQGEAKRVMDLLDNLFPKSKQYRERICQVAHEQGYLLSRYGCIRWFWEVFKWEGGRYVSGGDDHEAALSFFTQNDGHCYLKEAMLRLDHLGLLERYWAIDTIHDNLMFECLRDRMEEAIITVAPEMSRPSPILIDPVVAPKGLIIPVTVSMGTPGGAWNAMTEVDWRKYGTTNGNVAGA